MQSGQPDYKAPAPDAKHHELPCTPKDHYQSFYSSADNLVLGKQGMLQHHFTDQKRAEEFKDWLKSESILKPLAIEKANVEENKESKTWVVRLSENQYNVLMGDAKQFSQLLSEDKINEYCKKLFLVIQNKKLDEFNQAMALIPSVDINHLRLLARLNNDKINLLIFILWECDATFVRNFLRVILDFPLNVALVKQGDDKWTALHTAARYQSAEAFIELVEKCSAAELDVALVKQNDYKWTALHTVARYQSAEAFIELVRKCSDAKLDEALVKQHNENRTALHIAAQSQSAEAFIELIRKCSAAKLGEALVKQDSENWTALHMAARCQSAGAFVALIRKCSAAELDEALVKQDNGNWTALLTAAGDQSAGAFIELVRKCSAAKLGEALVKQDNGNWTALHTAARIQSAEAFIELIIKCSTDKLDEALIKQDEEKDTVLHELSGAKMTKNYWQFWIEFRKSHLPTLPAY